ncbi:toll/interleukin-1 receptor domain-containing protein [Nocardia sp. NPDC058658]|uniref:toll/interleukin-1 receptor domain-containing protein n=1 Tax=Nocardia sp. NPDC058658 TaxID=3346580 RepID=UPI00364FDB48
MKVFLNYRTIDSVYAVGQISAQLARRFGRVHVFRDQDSLPLGAIYSRRIRAALAESDVVVAVIGRHWLDARDKRGVRCIDNERDWVRMELRTAFEQGIPVVPVLLDDTLLPVSDSLPDDIRALTLSQGWRIRHQSLENDINGLIRRLTPSDETPTPDPPQATQQPATQQNSATNRGIVVANQNGTQNVTLNNPDRR